jgi:hypothetical protein
MKKKYFSIFILSAFWFSSYGQNCETDINQDFIKKIIDRNIDIPYGVECDYTGIGLVEIYKENDSVKMKSIYYSCSAYDFSNQRSLSKALNKYCKDSIPETCKIICPIIYYYNDNDSLQKPAEYKFAAMNQNIARFKKKKNVIIFSPAQWTYGHPIIDRLFDPPLAPIIKDSLTTRSYNKPGNKNNN